MIEYHNNIAIIKDATHWTEWVKKRNKLDVDELAHFLADKYINQGDTVLDIGANIGSHSIVYANKITDIGKLYTIDADPEHCICLRHNLPDWVRVMEFAVSDTIDSIGFKKYPDTGCNRCTNTEYDFVVNTFPIDYYFIDIKINFIKMDIEGYEVKALNGMKQILEKFRPIICLESNQSALQQAGSSQQHLYELLDSLNYEFRCIEQSCSLFDAQPNILCVHK